MKRLVKLSVFVLFAFYAFSACEKDDPINQEHEEEIAGVIRNESDAEKVAQEINNILENIRSDTDYGYTYTNYSPEEVNGGYSITGNAISKPIFSGSYTTEYIKNYVVTFNNYILTNGTIIEKGSIDYSFHDYSTSGYHLIIEVKSTAGIYITCKNDEYTITDVITNLSMGDKNDSKYNIWASFRSSNGKSYSVQGL